jgi:hypothetical protein
MIFTEAIEALQALPAKMGGSPKGRIDKTKLQSKFKK